MSAARHHRRPLSRVWADHDERVAFWLASWRAAWPTDGAERTLPPDAGRLEYVIADLTDGSVDAALRRTLATVPPGGGRPAAAFISECRRRRADSWHRAARSVWLIDLLCPDCESPAMQLGVASRPEVHCLECGRQVRVVRTQL